MVENTDNSDSGSRIDEINSSQSKVGRLIDEYELDDLGDELVRSWSANDDERRSLRELAQFFNQRLLHAAMEEAETNLLEGEVENMYRLLTDDETSAGARTQAETTLDRAGIDIERLQQDFVSHQAIYRYLTKYRSVDRSEESNDTDTIENVEEAIQRLQNRLIAVIENNLQNFQNTNRVKIGPFDVFVDVRVYCEECNKQYDIHELLNRRSCECDSTEK
jgi:hypothetical protein